jgi:hypothetical protein
MILKKKSTFLSSEFIRCTSYAANKFAATFAIVISCISISYAQKNITTQILTTYTKDKRIAQNQDITTFAKSLRYHSPIIKQIEARIGINGSTYGDSLFGGIRNEDNYGLILSTNSFKEIRLQKSVKQAQIEALDSENRMIEQQALVERYQVLNTLFFTQKLMVEKKKLGELIQKKHDILSKMIDNALDVKIKEVLDTEGDKNTIELSLIELENEVKIKSDLLQLLTQSAMATNIEMPDFITIAKIKEVIETTQTVNNHPAIDYRKARTTLSASQVDFISAQNRQVFNSLRLGYQNPVYLEEPKKLNPFNNFSVRVGLVVPLPANNNFKRSDALLELREAQNETTTTKEMYQKNIDYQRIKLKNLFEQRRLTQEKTDNSLIHKLMKNEKLLAQMSPLDIAEGHILQQKLRVHLFEIDTDITTEYVKLLDFNGIISTKPLRNYLTNNLELIEGN